jgi:hypothetical protein
MKVPLGGIEPPSQPPQGCALSFKLQGLYFFSFLFYHKNGYLKMEEWPNGKAKDC